MGVLRKSGADLMELLNLKKNEVVSLEAAETQLDLIARLTGTCFKLEVHNSRPALKDLGHTHEASLKMLQNHNAIISQVHLLKAEWEGCLEGAGNSFELKQLLKNAFTNVEEQLNDKKSQLNLKLQAEEIGNGFLPSLTPLLPSFPVTSSSPRGFYGNQTAPSIVQGCKDKNQKFGLPCCLEVHVMAAPEAEIYWFLNHSLLATITPTTTNNNDKNITTSKQTANNNTNIYKLNIANFGHDYTGLYTLIARNQAGEVSCKCRLDHISNHSTPRSNQSPMTNRSISREDNRSDHNHPLSSIPEDNFQGPPRFLEGLRGTDAWEGDSVLFKVHLLGTPEAEVRWFREGVEIANSPDFRLSRDSRFRNIHLLEIPEIFLEDAGRFTCIATNALGSCQSTATLVVRVPSELASIPGLYSDQSLEDFGLSFTPTSRSTTSSVVNLSSCIINTQALPMGTSEDCIKPYFKAISRDLEVSNGKVARFDSMVAGKPVPDVMWFRDDRRLMTDDKYAVVVNEKGVNSLIINACDLHDSGIYRCIACNSGGQDQFQVKLTVTVGPTRISPTGSMTFLNNAPPNYSILRNFHSEERGSNRVRGQTRKSDIHSEERSVVRRNFYKTTDVKQTHTSLRDHINGRGSPKKFVFSKLSAVNSTDEASAGPPQLLQPIDDPEVQEGDCALLECRVFSPGKCFYQWFFNNQPLQNDPNKYEITAHNDRYSLKVWDLNANDRGFYQCTVVNQDGEVTCIGRVNPLGSVISRPGSEIKICKSPTPFNLPSYCTRTIQEVKLSCTVIGRPKPKLTWYIGDEIILPTCEDFKSSYDKETGLVELRIRNVEKYLNRKIKCVAENERGVAETECILTDSLLSDPTFTHPDYSNLLIHQISSRHNLPSFNTAPRFSHRVKPKMVAEGDAVTLSAVVHGRPQPIVKWMKDGVTEIIPSKRHVLIFNERSNVCQLKILNCQALDSGTYSCVAYNPNGQTTCSTSLFIAPPGSPSLTFDLGSGIPVTEKFPQFTANLEPTYKATVGQPVKFTCRIKKEPSLHVTWYFNGIEISSGHVMKVVDGDVISSLSIPHPKPANKGEYSCHVRNLHGEATTSTYLEVEESTITTVQYSTREEELKFSMPVLQTHSMALPPNEDINRYYNAPPSFQQPLVNHITTEGSEAFLVVRFMGEPAPSIQWFVNGNLISEKNSNYRITSDFSRKESILYLKEVFAGDDGEYTCKAENISGIAYTTSHLYIKTSSRQGMREESYLSGSSHAEDGKPKFNVALTLARPERHVEVGREFELHDERETRRVQVERKFSVPPEQAFSETISIDKSEQKVVEVDVPKPRKMSEVHIQRPSVTSAISEMDVEMMKSIDLVPQKDPQQFVTTQDCELRKLQIESEYALVPEANFTETVSIDKSEVQEVVFDSPATKKTSEVILNQEASLQGVKMEAEIILLEEPQNFSETVSIDRSRDQEVEFSVQKSQQTSELTVQQQSMPKGSRIEAEILPEEKQTTELLVERGSAPKFLVELVPVNVMDGSPVYFTTKVFASPMPEYVTWYRNEQNCEEVVHIHVDYDIETGVSNLHIAEVFPEDSGRYTCVVSNQFGTAKSTATLTVSAYDTTEMLEYDEVSRISSDEDAAACNLIEGKVVRSDMTKERSVHVQPSHAKLRKTETSTNEFTQPFVQMIENKQIRSSVEAGVALGRNKTNVCSYMAKQIKQDPGRFERVFDILEKNLRKSPLNWEVVVRNVQGIDGKMVLPTLARLAVTKLNVEETKILVDAIQKVKITHSLESATPLERNEGVKVPFMSKQIKKDVCKYEVVDENMDCEGDECIENVCGISEDYPNCQLIHKELCKVVKGHNVSTLTKLIHAEKDSVENVDLIREDRNFEKLASKPEPRPVFDMSSKSVVASLAKQISKSPECFEAVDEAFDSSGYESTGRLSDSSDGPMLGTQYVTSCLSHASVKQKVPALTKTLVDRNYNLEVSFPEHKVYLEDKATPGFEPTLAMSKGLGVKTQFRTKQRRKEPLHCDVVDGELISDLSLHSSDTKYEVTKDRLLSRSVKNVLTTNVLAKRTELTLEETGEDVRGHQQQQPTTSFELQFCSEKNEKSETHFRSNQLNKDVCKYEVVDENMDCEGDECIENVCGISEDYPNYQLIHKELCKVVKGHNVSTLTKLIHAEEDSVENVDLIREDRNFEKLASKPEPRPVFDMSSKSVVASLAKQITPECFEAVDEAFDSSGYESTGRLSDSSDGPMLGTQYVTSCLSHASVKQKVPALTKTLVDRNYNLEVSLPEHKVYLEDKATPGFEPTLAMSKGLGVKTQFRTKQRRKEPLHCDVVDGELISDLSLHSSDTRYEVTKDRLLSRSVKNVLTTNVLAKLTELTLEETGEDVRGHQQQQPTTSFELQFCSEKNEKSEIHFRSNQLNKGKSVYETVSHKVQSPEQEIVSGLGDQLLNSTRSEVVTKEACKPHVESSLTTRVSSNRCSLVLEQTSDMEERKENKCNSLVEATPTFASRNLVLVPFLARQIPKDKDKFETVCHTKSLAHETTGEFITNFDSFANTSEMTTKLLGKATTSCSVLSLAVLARTTMLHWESVFPFARLLNEDRANLSEQEASLIAALESTTTSFMTKPLTKTLQSYESIDNSLASLSLCSDKLSATETSKSVHFEYSSKTSALFHSPHLTTKATDVDCVDNTFDEKPVVKAEINFEPSFVKRGQSKTRQNIYAAYQYLDSESDAQSDSVSTTAIDMRPSEKAFEQYISKVTVMSEPVKMHEYHITPLLEQFAEERLYGVSSDYSSTQVSATLTENNLVNQSSKVFNKTFTPVVKAKDDFVDTVKTLEIHIKPEEIKHEEVTVDIGMGRKEPATLLHGASQRLQLNLDRVEELKTSFKSTYIPCHDIPSDLEMSDVSQPTPTFIRSSIDHAKHQQIHGINVDLNFNHTFPDLISANFNKYVDKMKLINHSSSIVDIKKAEVVRMMEQPFIKSILSVPEKVGVRLMRLECIDTTLFRTSLLEYLMLLEQQFAFKSIDLDSETTVIPYADIVTVETGMASSEDKAKTRLLTNVYFLQLEEVQDVDYSVSSCKNQETVSASAQFHFSEKSKLINYCLQQFKSTNTENVVLEALSKISAMLCVPENMVCSIERGHVSDATLYRAPLTDYVLLLEKVLSMQAFNIDDLAVILPHSEMVTLQTGLAMLSQKPLLRSQANVFFLKLDDVSENDTSIESFSIQPDVLIKEINCSYKQEKEATFVLPLTSNRQQELTFETISPKLAPTYNAPKEEQSNFKKIHKDDKVLSRVSVSDYILLLEKIMALNTFNIDNAAMNLPTPDLVLLQTFHASQQAQPLTRVQPNLFYLQLEQAEDFSAKVDNEDAQISKTGSEMFQLENKMTFLSHIQATVNHKKQEQISEKMILNTISNVSNTFCIPQNVVCKIDRAHKSDAVLYRAPLVDYVLLLDRMLSLQSMNLDDLSVVLPQAELTLLQTSLAMTSQRPLHRSQHQLYLLKIENAIEKNMSLESFSIKPQHIVREIAKANKQRPYSYSPSRTHNKQPDHVQAANNNVEAKDRRMPDFIKSTFSKSSQKDKVLSRVSVSEYMLLLERLVALDGLSIDDCSVKLPLPDLAILQTVTASCEDKPCSRVQPSLFFMNLEQVATHDSHVEKSTANASQTKVQLDVQSSMSKVKEYFKEPQEVVEEEEKALMNEPIKQKPDDEDFFEDMFETWETKQKTEVTAESEGESDSSTESLYEEWEFTTIKKRVVEEEFPTKRSVIQVERPESQESTMFMERSQNTTSAYSDEKDYSSSTSFDRSVFCTDVFNKVIRKNVDESYTRPSFMTEITTSERVKNHSVTLSSVVSAIPEPEIEWYKDGMKIANSRHFSTYYGDGSCKLTIHKFTPRYSGRYACRAINEVGMNESYINLDYDFFEPDGQEVDKSYDHMTFEESFVEIKEEWMNVVTEDISYKSLQIPTAPAFEQEISSITVVDGGNVTLYCKLLSYPEATIEWYLRNKLIKQSQDFRMGYKDDYCYLNIREAMPHDQGEYTVKAYNEHGFAETIIYLTVLDTYELSETREVKTRSSKTQRFYKETSTKDVDCMETERKMKSFKAQSAESRAAKKALRAVDSDEEAYSSGEESLEMWTIEEWLFYDYKKYYNADVFVKKRDDYLEYYKYVPYDEKSFLERISSVKAALSDTHAFRFPVIIKELPILEVFEGKRVEMECVVEAKPLPQITWFKNGKRLESSEHVRLTFENNVAKLSIEQALLDDEAEYKCEARNDYGSSFTWGQLYVETVQLRWGRIKNFKIVRKKCLL